MKCRAIDNPSSSEIPVPILFLHAINASDAQIHRELCATVCAENIMLEGTVRLFKGARTDVQDEE
jgi:hypothetical protein